MTTTNNLDMPSFDDNDVVSFQDGTVRMARLKQALDLAMSSKLPDALMDSLVTQKLHLNGDRHFRDSRAWNRKDVNWFQEGIDCEVLQLGAPTWRRGKLRLRVSVEFIPDDEFEPDEFATFDTTISPEPLNGKPKGYLNGNYYDLEHDIH